MHDSVRADDTGEAGNGTPRLLLSGFDGPLALLLRLARAEQIDLARLSLVDLLDQLAVALQQATPTTPLGERADWLVMASWLLLLRSRLLLPSDAAGQQDAADLADRLREDLLTLQAAQALARWLEDRPQLGRDVFARGQPELLGTALDVQHAVDVIEFLWASMALFDDGAAMPDTTPVYRPYWRDLHTADDARARILRLLDEIPDGTPLGRFLPAGPEAAGRGVAAPALRRRSAWSSTFVAGLELTRLGRLALQQTVSFGEIQVHAAARARAAEADGAGAANPGQGRGDGETAA